LFTGECEWERKNYVSFLVIDLAAQLVILQNGIFIHANSEACYSHRSGDQISENYVRALCIEGRRSQELGRAIMKRRVSLIADRQSKDLTSSRIKIGLDAGNA
jgi:hypothetical protein